MECGVDPILTIVQIGGDEWFWQLGAPELRYYWVVKILNTRLTWFRGGTGTCGQDHLCEFATALDLECLIRRWAPAHTAVIFDYSDVDYVDPDGIGIITDDGQSLTTDDGSRIVQTLSPTILTDDGSVLVSDSDVPLAAL